MDIQLRQMTLKDLPFCSTLVKQAGWNQIDQDWNRLMTLHTTGCFIANMNGRSVGTIASTRFLPDQKGKSQDCAWISMVLVHQEYRGQGIGREMMVHTVDYLKEQRINTIRLDATSMGQKLYSNLGFKEEYELVRMVRQTTTSPEPASIRSTDVDAQFLADLDIRYTATNRIKLYEKLIGETSTGILTASDTDNSISGFAIIRPGRLAWQIGPCISADPQLGKVLLTRALSYIPSEKVMIDIPTSNNLALKWAIQNKFVEQRKFVRMYYGHKIEDSPLNIMASFGPEKG